MWNPHNNYIRGIFVAFVMLFLLLFAYASVTILCEKQWSNSCILYPTNRTTWINIGSQNCAHQTFTFVLNIYYKYIYWMYCSYLGDEERKRSILSVHYEECPSQTAMLLEQPWQEIRLIWSVVYKNAGLIMWLLSFMPVLGHDTVTKMQCRLSTSRWRYITKCYARQINT